MTYVCEYVENAMMIIWNRNRKLKTFQLVHVFIFSVTYVWLVKKGDFSFIDENKHWEKLLRYKCFISITFLD